MADEVQWWDNRIAGVVHAGDGPESDRNRVTKEALLIGDPNGPPTLDKSETPWLELRRFALRVVCPDGKEHKRTHVLQTAHIPRPEHPTNAQISEYAAAIKKQDALDVAELDAELRTLQLKCTEFAVPDPPHHHGGAPHADESYQGGTICPCGQDHGAHNYLGLARCWCGVLNEGRGAAR